MAPIAGLLVLTLLLAFSGTVAADHLYATGQLSPGVAGGENRINLFVPVCFDGTTDLFYDADTGFFVAHGWANGPWNDLTPVEKRAYASKATKFELSIDGEVQKSVKRMGFLLIDGDKFKVKTFVIEDHDGLSGDFEFVGRWYIDASDPFFGGGKFGVPILIFECVYTVHFA